MRYYAIADLHGRFDLLNQARQIIKEDSSDLTEDQFKIITLGDYIDRGPQSNEIISSLMESQKLYPYMVCLQGNHEDMLVQTVTKPLDSGWWVGNGGWQTLQSYNSDAMPWEVSWVNQDHVRWMASLPLYYETEKQVFVHAGIPNEGDLDRQDTEKLLWMLYSKGDQGGWRGKHVVHGHHQFADGPHEWSSRTDLDVFAWYTGRLVVGVFDDTQGKALRYIEVFGDDYKKAINLG